MDLNERRPIRFMGYDTSRKKFFSPEEMGQDELTINPDGRGFVNVSGASTRLSQYLSHIVPLQFTGRLDDKGKEIYEGHLVRYGPACYDAEVVFHDGSFWL